MPAPCASIINLSYPPGSVGSASNPDRFDRAQDFTELKNYYVERKRLFVDKEFPPNNFSLGDVDGLTSSQEAQVRWCRPKEILDILGIKEDPVYRSCCESRFDFGQGMIGNCWFLAAISSLTLNKKLTKQVVPEQSFDDYAGIFHFRFWRFGKWVDVVIDDFLPVFQNQFLSVHAKQTNEFWVPLLEKAYAKVCGSYADMNAGWTSESCKDMTGGLSLDFPLQQVHNDEHDAELWCCLSSGQTCKSMMCCGTPSVNSGRVVNSIRENGLVNAHAYSVTKTAEVYHRGSKVKLLRVMNPWGVQEWNGKWSDNSPLWEQVSREDQAKCKKDDNGEFWIELEDFCHNFNCLTICCENPNFMDGDLGCQWQVIQHEGAWTTAGGSLNDYTFHTNPQFRVTIDIRNEEEEFDMNCFVSLMQKPNERNRKKSRYFPVATYVFQIPPGTSEGRLDRSFFLRNKPFMEAQFTNIREITNWYSLVPGEYLIVPSTLRQYMRNDFVLSVYTKSEMQIHSYEGEEEHDDDHEHDHGHGDDHDHNNGTDHGDNHDNGDDHNNHGHESDNEENGHIEETEDEYSHAKDLFDQYANGRRELNAKQLQKLLNENVTYGMWDSFSRDACMDFIIMMNTDRRPRMMNFEEFSELWKKIVKYKQIFEDADANHNGVLNQAELESAIQAAGMPSSDGWVDVAIFRYSFGKTSLNLLNFLDLMMHLDHKTSFFNDHFFDGFFKVTTDDWFSDVTFW